MWDEKQWEWGGVFIGGGLPSKGSFLFSIEYHIFMRKCLFPLFPLCCTSKIVVMTSWICFLICLLLNWPKISFPTRGNLFPLFLLTSIFIHQCTKLVSLSLGLDVQHLLEGASRFFFICSWQHKKSPLRIFK